MWRNIGNDKFQLRRYYDEKVIMLFCNNTCSNFCYRRAITFFVSWGKCNWFIYLVYMPWTILQGGLEECGWRWYLQPKLDIKSYILKMFLISIVWFLWHIPIYRLPWITAGSSNYLIFYLMILGNTFMFGEIKEYSKGVLPCVIAHILIDSLAAAMLVGSNIIKIGILVGVEVIISIFCVIVRKENNSKIRRRTLDICKTLWISIYALLHCGAL